MKEKIKEDIIKYRFEHPEKSYELCKELYRMAYLENNNYLISYAFLYMGDTSLTLGRIEDAFTYLDKAILLQKSYGYDDLLMHAYNIVGITYNTINDSCREMECYYKSLEVAKRQQNYVMQSMLYYNIGCLYMDMEEPFKAMEFFQRGYEREQKQRRETSLTFPEMERHLNLAISHRMLKEYENAYQEIMMAENLKECSKFISVMGEKVNILMEMGKKEEAVLCMKRIAELPMQEFRRIEFIKILIKTVQWMVETDQIALAEQVTQKCAKTLEKKAPDYIKKLLCQMQILIAEAKQDTQRQFTLYRRYAKLTKKLRAEDQKSIILSLDKRIHVEKERYRNQKMDKANRTLMEQSYIDTLTGLYNRHGMWKYVNKNFHKVQQEQKKFGLMIIDVDHFKHLNDTLGHLEGDCCLKSIAGIILQFKAKDCYAVRYGGDEFMILSVGQPDCKVEKVARQIRQAVYDQKRSYEYEGREEQITVSIGAVNDIPGKDMQFLDYINQADQKLYDAKKSGRNVVVFA